MTLPRGLHVGTAPKEAWRRFAYAHCHDCPFQIVLRDYRSHRARNRKAIAIATLRHLTENPDHGVEGGYGHGT